jgi:hypothetical protein
VDRTCQQQASTVVLATRVFSQVQQWPLKAASLRGSENSSPPLLEASHFTAFILPSKCAIMCGFPSIIPWLLSFSTDFLFCFANFRSSTVVSTLLAGTLSRWRPGPRTVCDRIAYSAGGTHILMASLTQKYNSKFILTVSLKAANRLHAHG